MYFVSFSTTTTLRLRSICTETCVPADASAAGTVSGRAAAASTGKEAKDNKDKKEKPKTKAPNPSSAGTAAGITNMSVHGHSCPW